jgi:predicted nucleic acid-binding protein
VNYLIDTSALKWAYIDRTKHTRRCRYILSRAACRVFIAEITMLELGSALAGRVRDNQMSAREFQRADLRFLKDVGSGRISVVAMSKSDLLRCRELLVLVGFVQAKPLKTQDAMVAYAARLLALETGLRTHVLTSDRKLDSVLNQVTLFSGLVTSEYLDPN